MTDASSLSWTPALERCQLTTVNVLVHLPIVSDNGQAFEFTHQRSTGEEQLLALIAMLKPLQSNLKVTDLIFGKVFSLSEKLSLS